MTEKPIHIVHVMPQIGIGGAERQLYELIRNSDPAIMTHEVFYYSDSRDDEAYKLYAKAGIKLTRIPRNKKRPIKFLNELAARIKASCADIVQCWLVSGNFWGRLAAIYAGAKHIIVAWRNCDLWKPIGARLLEWLTYGRAQHLANSRACAEFIAKRLWISPDKFTVIYNGLETGKFNLPDRRKELFAGLNIPEDYKIVTMVGRLMEQKNYPMLIRVAQKTKQMSLPLHFVIAGTGDLLNSLIEISRRLKVDDRVHFIGVRNDIPQILAASDIFLFTTNFEGFPNALLEAMAAGLPIITTNFAGIDELVQNGITGRIVPIDDVNSTVNILREYLDRPDQARQMAIGAQDFVRREFSMQKMVQKTTALYKAILTGESKPGQIVNPLTIDRST
jgi:glycosyltransferase involved in cell wall biosynthesis